MNTIRIHVAGSAAWQALLANASAATSPAFLCGEIAAPTQVPYILDAHRHAGAILLASVPGPPDLRLADLDGANELVTDRVSELRAILTVELALALGLAIEPCARCLGNVATMREADQRKLERKQSAGFIAAPARATSEIPREPKKPDPRQERADSRWSEAVSKVKAKAAKPKKKAAAR